MRCINFVVWFLWAALSAGLAHAQLLPDVPEASTGQELIDSIPRKAREFPALTERLQEASISVAEP